MKSAFYAIICVALVSGCFAAPFADVPSKDDPELTAGYFEGDIILDQLNRNGLIAENSRWPGKTVPYIITESYFSSAHINHIREGMRIIESVSCIRFREASKGERNYVNVTGLNGGCYSNVGFLNRTQQVNFQVYPLDTGCFRLGTIVHEFLHTLGIFHQQSAANRDEYVRIAEENIQDGKENNFYKYNDTYVHDFGEEYDYGSVMHYTAFAFTKNGEMTIVPLKEGITSDVMGQRRGMSKSDINKLNVMYRCPIGV